jgi:AcrR family transcriptional regulator
MAPRKYNHEKRHAASEAIRQRILESTLALHAENGIFGTSWKDIAKHADVSLATVYNYFPSLNELVPACGELMYAITQPPSLEDAETIFSGSTTVEDRLGRLTKALYDFYERGEAYLDLDHQERKLDSVKEWEAYLKSLIDDLTRIALKPTKDDERTVEIIAALLDVPIFLSFRRRGMSRMQIEQVINKLLVCSINDSTH